MGEIEKQQKLESKFMTAIRPSIDELECEIPQDLITLATPHVQRPGESNPNKDLQQGLSNRGKIKPEELTKINQRQSEIEENLRGKVVFKTQNDLKLGFKPFELEPSPIMSLYNRQGVNTHTGEIDFSTDSTAIALSNKNIICLNILNGYQRFLIGHDNKVSCFSVVPDDNILISADDTENSEIIVWRIVPARIICKFKVDMKAVKVIDCCKFTKDDK